MTDAEIRPVFDILHPTFCMQGAFFITLLAKLV